MKLPVDTSAIAFLCAVEAEPVVDFETKRPRADENGEPLYVVQLIAMTDGAAEILAVKVPGMPRRPSGRATRSRSPAWSPSPGRWPTAPGCRSGPLASSRPSPRPRPANGRRTLRPSTARDGGAGRPAVGSRPLHHHGPGARNTGPLHQVEP